MKYLLIAFLLILAMNINAHERWFKGYITTNNNEIVKGQIFVSGNSPFTNAVVFAGIDLEGFYGVVRFKNDMGKIFIYEPDDIRAFGFSYFGTDYKFVSNLLLFKSLIKSDRARQRFLCLEYKGAVSLFNDCVTLQHDVVGVGGGRNLEYITYHEYYLYSEEKGLLWVDLRGKANLKHYLIKSGVNEQFIIEYPDVLKVRELQTILKSYDNWLVSRKEEGLST